MTEAVVATRAEAVDLEFGAAVVIEPLEGFLDEIGLTGGEVQVEEIGGGHSNLSFLIRRDHRRMVLRRPPRGPIFASANDVLRESRVLEALRPTQVPVPEILARCGDPEVIGAPFFLMTFIEGSPINDGLPPSLAVPDAAERIVEELVSTLADLHATSLTDTDLGAIGKPNGYLERQLRRFSALLDANATRPLPELERIAEWLSNHRPTTPTATFVHGDYRLGNVMFVAPLRLAAVLDWEMATVGDPLADLGHLTATWAEPGDEISPMLALSRLTLAPGFPGREDVARRYAQITGRAVASLPWYQVLALWKSAIFLEGSYKRYRTGASSDPFFADLEQGVPMLGRAAQARIESAESSL